MTSPISNNHPITPPPELVEQWMHEASGQPPGPDARVIATQAARWGADQQLQLDAEQINQSWQKGADYELKACCDWLNFHSAAAYASDLRTARRPKPPSLKERIATAIAHGDNSIALALLDQALPS